MNFDLWMIGFVVLAIWLSIITFFFWKLSAHYNRLTKGKTDKTLTSVLEEILHTLSVAQKDIDQLKNRCDTIEKDSVLHIQRIGLLRFNPFKETGGNQSFVLALVDKNDTGVIISSLYARSGTRWYAKRVLIGKGVDHELSDDEKQAIKEARVLPH